MTVKLSTGDRNAALDARAAAYTGGVIYVYSGTQPIGADAAPTGTLLGVITENGGAWIAGNPANGLKFKPATAGVLQKSDDTWRMTGLAKGTAGWWRFVTNAADDGSESTTLRRWDGSIGVGAGELRLSTTAIDVGVPVSVDRFTVRQPG